MNCKGTIQLYLPICLLIVMPVRMMADDQFSSATALYHELTSHYEMIDMSYPLNDQTNYWPGDDYEPFKLVTIATIKKDGVLSKAVSFPEHIGTHIDAPNHFELNQPALNQINLDQLIRPGVLIDISPQAEIDADYGCTLQDVKNWETKHSRIPQGAIVLLKTGWGRFWHQPVRFMNRDTRGILHFPSFLADAAEYLVNERDIAGIGVDNLSIDRGISKDFRVHHIINGAGKFGLENVRIPQNFPANNFLLIIAPLKIENGTGGPTRIFAIVPKTSSK